MISNHIILQICSNNLILCINLYNYIVCNQLLLSHILTKAVKGGHVSTLIFLILIIRDFEERCNGREYIGNTM